MTPINGGKLGTVLFFSNNLNETQKKWSVSEKEMWAIIYGINKSKYHIGGRQVVVLSDHRALHFNDKESASPKIERWKLRLQEFDLTFRYIRGEDNVIADALSRLTTPYEMRIEQDIPIELELGNQFEGSPLLCLSANSFPKYSIDDETGELVKRVHGGEHGHWSSRQAIETLKRLQITDESIRVLMSVGWEKRVEQKIRSCKFCLFMKHGTADHGITYSTAAQFPGTHWSCDTKSMYEDGNGYKHLLVVVDMCSRFVYLRALKSVGGEEACSVLEDLIRDCGSPSLCSIRHDAGTQFIDTRVQAMFADHNIESVITVAGNKQQNGLAERMIQTVRVQLAAQQWDSGNIEWSEELVNTEVALNTAYRLAAGIRPVDLHTALGPTRKQDLEKFLEKRELMAYKPKEDENWLEEEEGWILALRTDKKKLDILPRVWDGPFQVIARTGQLVEIQDVAGNRSFIPVSNTKQYKPELDEDVEETALIMFNECNEGEPFYIMNRVIDHHPKQNITMGNLKLKVSFKGYTGADWYDVKANKGFLKTESFVKYTEFNRELVGFISLN